MRIYNDTVTNLDLVDFKYCNLQENQVIFLFNNISINIILKLFVHALLWW